MEDYYKEKNIKGQKKKKIKKKVINFLYVLIIPILLWNLIITVKILQNPDKTPSIFGIKTFCIISGSMEPTLQINDIIIIKEVSKNEISEEDIITFKANEETITHRVKKIEKYGDEIIYITQGDANNIEDENKISFENVEGKYICRIPKVGKIVLVLKNRNTLTIVLALLISSYIIKQRIDNKKIKRANERIEYEKNKRENST